MKPLKVVCYSDGRPGHEKQSIAVISALDALTPLFVDHRNLYETSGIKRAVEGVTTFLGITGETERSSPIAADLVIGTGSTTHLPVLGVKLRTAARSVTCMTPGPWLRPWFDLCIVPRHDGLRNGKKYFSTFGPPCLSLHSNRHNCRKGLVLAGGLDSKSHQWDTAYFIAQVKKLIDRMPNLSWTLSSSVRTPSDTVEQLRHLATAHDNILFLNADETPRGWIETAYEEHAQVWVSADSVSMVYEALTAGCRVGVLPVKWKNSNNKFQDGINDLKKNKMVIDFEQWLNGMELPLNTKPLNEAERCAKEILKRWWPERLA